MKFYSLNGITLRHRAEPENQAVTACYTIPPYGRCRCARSLYSLHSVALGSYRLAHQLKADDSIKSVRIIASTDLNIDGANLLFAYHSRFQIEILYRDAKQHLGLTHCQARSEQKIDFHLNASLSTVSLAKVAYHLSDPKHRQKPFSLADIKTQCINELLLDRFISTLGINPLLPKIKAIRDKIKDIGKIAA